MLPGRLITENRTAFILFENQEPSKASFFRAKQMRTVEKQDFGVEKSNIAFNHL